MTEISTKTIDVPSTGGSTTIYLKVEKKVVGNAPPTYKTTPYSDITLKEEISEIDFSFPANGRPGYTLNFQIVTADYQFSNNSLNFPSDDSSDVSAGELTGSVGRTDNILPVTFTDVVTISNAVSLSFNVTEGSSGKSFLADPQVKITRKTS
ncbi:hypothetical protein [Arenicella xantha]|uniref:Uncharacterized protein n=1 Tax=Arenicella xantha TaxID=644221 RepID=A0A395JMN3_9GAMM|nr:hypothetical protein [Arenicella xantha]RBP52890.1 hypothetical protein DFR28_101274 [Arenicella xantha]